MSAALQFAFDFQTMECGECGIVFAITNAKYYRCKNHGEGWYCPNGHSRKFCESEVEKLKKEVELEKQRHEWTKRSLEYTKKDRDHNKHKAAAYKGTVTKIKKRVGNGVCPCCNRTFQNLANHMKNQHPDFRVEDPK